MGQVVQNWTCVILFRIVLPLVLLIATFLRFNFLSTIYGFLALTAPLLKRPTRTSLRSHTGRFLIVTLVLCCLTLLSQIIFQIYIAVSRVDIKNCSSLAITLHHIGFQRFESNVGAMAQMIIPDIAAFVVSLVVFICCHTLLRQHTRESTHHHSSRMIHIIHKTRQIILDYFAIFVTFIFMTFAGILDPSALSCVYFVAMLSWVTIWSVTNHPKRRWLQRMRIFLLVYSAIHLFLAYHVNFQYVQRLWKEHVKPNGTFERSFGLRLLINTDCANVDNVYKFNNDLPWTAFANIIVIVIFYFILAWEIRRCYNKDYQRLRSASASIHSHAPVTDKGEELKPVLSHIKDTEQGLSAEPAVSFANARPDSPDFGSVVIADTTFEEINAQQMKQNKKRNLLNSIGVYIREQSYIGTLIIMMAWSIAYHSWLTFVFLCGACFIWILPQKQKICLRASPFILFYALCLLILQYIYALNLTDEELPVTTNSGYKFQEIGLVKYKHPAIPLGIKIAFTCMFWLTVRNFIWQIHLKAKTKNLSSDIPLENMREHDVHDLNNYKSKDGETVKSIGRWVWHKLSKYWILACAALFLAISLQEAVIFRIVYMGLFLLFLITFQLSYRFWRLCINGFWWLVILYSMVVLSCIYTFQFEGFPHLWQNNTGMSEQMLTSLGLRQFDTAALFVQLLTPTSFLIVIIVQLHYFQKTFLEISDLKRFQESIPHESDVPNNTDDNEIEGEENHMLIRRSVSRRSPAKRRRGVVKYSLKDRLFILFGYVWTKLNDFLDSLSVILWRLLEIHIFKAVVITIFLCCITEVTGVNYFLVVCVIAFMPFERAHYALSVITLIYSSLILMLKMIYQLDSVPHTMMITVCRQPSVNESSPVSYNETSYNQMRNNSNVNYMERMIDSSKYIGLQKEKYMARYVMIYIIIILLLAFEAVIKYHQMQYYNKPGNVRPMRGIVFKEIRRPDADKGIKECVMFLANYAFYKFGREVCFMTTMITMVVRLDMYSILYGIFLGILLLLRRRHCSCLWPIYMTILMIFLVSEYLILLGKPEAMCTEYPWFQNSVGRNLNVFLFLPNLLVYPLKHKLIGDFFQLLFVCLQWNIFWLEKNKLEEFGGGSNRSVIHNVEHNDPNPVSDFISYKNSYLDYVKMLIFFWSFWLTLLIVLVSGMSRISLFCMGYLIGCFVFLWFGEEMLLKRLRKLVGMWKGLLLYCYFVLLAKCCLQIVGCVYINDIGENHCWAIQLLNIICLQSGYYEMPMESMACNLKADEAGLSWDAVSFVFLLFMLRVFKSWYFQHVVFDLEIRHRLAARGAEVINETVIAEMNKQKRLEEEILHQIMMKMDRIRDRHRRCLEKKSEKVVEPTDHYFMIRSGDYYMFEDFPECEDEEDKFNQPDLPEEIPVDVTDWRSTKPAIGPIAIINAALLGGQKEALNLASGRISVFSSSRRSSSNRDYATPDQEMSPFLDPTIRSREDDDEEIQEPSPPDTSILRPERSVILTITPTSEFKHEQRLSPKHVAAVRPGEAISTVPEETKSMNEDEVFASVEPAKEDSADKHDDLSNTIVTGLKVAWLFFISLIESLTAFMYRISSKHRNVSHHLNAEKQLQKQEGLEKRRASSRDEGQGQSQRYDEADDEIDSQSVPGSRKHSSIGLLKKQSQKRFEENLEAQMTAEKEFHKRMPRLLLLIMATLEVLMSKTDIFCYFAMILTALMSGSILSLLLPLSIFFWGMLSVPRPTKLYWITVITYTEAIIVVKYLFQFSFFPWNTIQNNLPNASEFWPPRIIGIEKKESYASLDIFLLFCLFLHRMVLKSHGLWKDADDLQEDLDKAAIVSRNSDPASPATPSTSQLKALEETDDKETKESKEEVKVLQFSQPEPKTNEMQEIVSPDSQQDNSIKRCCIRIFNPLYKFYIYLSNPKYTAFCDIYAFMFACDLITFLIIVFGYSSFGPPSAEEGDVASVLQQSRVPLPFLIMLLLQFVFIIIDRALYLRKLIFGKFVFHLLLVILVHVWIFFVLPYITGRFFTENIAAQLWYFIKCIYFGLSCYQIRSGYPTRILGNFLTKNYNYLNLFCFKGFLAIPFLLELRALMDWMWTDTTLALTSWLQMEDIYANIFVLKCWRQAESKYPTPRGQSRTAVVKYGLGGLILIALIFIIWFPLLLFSLAGSILTANPPVLVDIQVKISGYQTLYSMSAEYRDIEKITRTHYEDIKKIYQSISDQPDYRALAFLSGYNDEDVYEVRVKGTSANVWDISYPSELNLGHELTTSQSIRLTTIIAITRGLQSSVSVPTVIGTFDRNLFRSNPEDKKIMETLARMINGSFNLNVAIPNMFPRYVTVPAQQRVNESFLLYGKYLSKSSVVLSLHEDANSKTRWWQVHENIAGNMIMHESSHRDFLSAPDLNKETILPYIKLITFNQRVPTGVLNVLNGYGIIGLYVSVILVIGRLLRMQAVGNIQNIMFLDLPFVDRIHGLCLDIYLARQAAELPLEEFLFSKLIFFYRSPETIIKWTRRPKEKED